MRRDDFELPVAPANDRPSDEYQCGMVCTGEHRKTQSCPLGPTTRGVCRHDKVPCSPVATAQLRSRRWKRTAFICGLIYLAVGTYTWKNYFYKPGDLSTPHAQILSGQLASASCAACHPQAATSPLAWFRSGHDQTSMLQSDRCMDCHHTRLPRDFARSAHNLSTAQLQQLRDAATPIKTVGWNQSLPRPIFADDDVACAACHREHAGASASLISLTDAQCQTCHSNRFTSFAVDHPAWNEWPYTSDEPIRFDHRSHAQRHFPNTRDDAGTATAFDCVRCHAKTTTGEFARITDYATSCGSCHDKALNQQVGERLDLLVLPSLVEPNQETVGNWPAAATGFYDGKIGPLARLLIPQNVTNQSALSTIPGEGDFTRINPGNSAQRQSAETIAMAIRETIEAIATAGPIPVAERLPVEQNGMRKLLQGLPPQLVGDAAQRWFNEARSPLGNAEQLRGNKQIVRIASAREPIANDDDLLIDNAGQKDALLTDSLIESEPLLTPTMPKPSDERKQRPEPRNRKTATLEHDPVTMQPDGGWYVDDSRLAISYRGHGHADPVIQSAIELAAGLALDNSIRKDLLRTGPAVSCIHCHQGANTIGAITWKPPAVSRNPKSQFTKFSHRPHINMPVLADCKHCHAISNDLNGSVDGLKMTTISYNDLELRVSHDFAPLARQTCASCHTANAAGDACIKCHRYHTEPLSNR